MLLPVATKVMIDGYDDKDGVTMMMFIIDRATVADGKYVSSGGDDGDEYNDNEHEDRDGVMLIDVADSHNIDGDDKLVSGTNHTE